MHRVLMLAVLSCSGGLAAETPKPPAPKTITELDQAIRKVLVETKTPGVGVSIVSRDRVLWTAGVGKADVASGLDVTPDTLFRIGSVSKSFVSLSVLKLQDEGKLHLTDTVRSLAPEIAFQNPWESTDPVRLVHLLEHTAGFDDLHFCEYANNDPTPLTLRAGLDYHPHSRTSRWRPGTCMSYCNSGPAFAAYIVEKVTGRRFEDYVKENFFRPLHMDTADYFLTPEVKQHLTRLYYPDGKTTYPYWHIIMRPAGAINASAREMANYVQFFLNRGSFGGMQLVPAADIDRMERPATTLAAQAGVLPGYGLSNYTTIHDGFIYHGHNGGVNGGLTELAYLREQGVGYVFMINSGSGDALDKIAKLIRSYLTRDLQKAPLPPAAPIHAGLLEPFLGYLEPVTPRQEAMRFLERILGVSRLLVKDNQLIIRPILGKQKEFRAVSGRLYRGADEPVASLALISSGPDGAVVQTGWNTYRSIPALFAWLEWGAGCVSLLLMATSILFALIWVPRKLLGRKVPKLSVRIVPLAAVLCLAASVALVMVSDDDILQRFGNLTLWSGGFCALTVAFALAAVAGLATVLRSRGIGMKRGVYLHSLAVAVANTLVAGYLAYWGMIGYRSWV